MIKRILFTCMVLLSIYSVAVVGYRLYEPDLKNTDENSTYINYNSLQEYTLSHGENTKHLYLFYSSADANSNYVKNTLLPSMHSSKGVDIADRIEIVDITSLDTSYTTNRMKAEWGIQTYPSFLLVSVENNQITIEDSLCWDEEHPFTADTIWNWLTIHQITQ